MKRCIHMVAPKSVTLRARSNSASHLLNVVYLLTDGAWDNFLLHNENSHDTTGKPMPACCSLTSSVEIAISASHPNLCNKKQDRSRTLETLLGDELLTRECTLVMAMRVNVKPGLVYSNTAAQGGRSNRVFQSMISMIHNVSTRLDMSCMLHSRSCIARKD